MSLTKNKTEAYFYVKYSKPIIIIQSMDIIIIDYGMTCMVLFKRKIFLIKKNGYSESWY